MYENRTLPKLLMATLLVLCSFLFSMQSYGQTFEYLRSVGAGGVSIGTITASTQVSSTQVAFFELPSTLVTYNSVTKAFTRTKVPYFEKNWNGAENNGFPISLAYVDDKFTFLVMEIINGIPNYSLVTTTKTLATAYVISLTGSTPIIEVIASVNANNVRLITVDGLMQVNVVNGKKRLISNKLPSGITNYVRMDDSDYVSTSTSIYRLTQSRPAKVVLQSSNTILSFIISSSSLSFINDNLDFVTVKNGIRQIQSYPSRKTNADYALLISTLTPTKLYRLANGEILGHDSSSIATWNSSYTFTSRYGWIGSFFYTWAPKDAVSENGTTAVGRAGFVSITDHLGNNKDVEIKSAYNIDALPVSLTFASEQYVLVAYYDFEPVWHTGLLLIDVSLGAVIRQIELNVTTIEDIEYNGNVYIAADGNLYSCDLFLSKQPILVPGVGASYNLSEQGGFLYVQQPWRGWDGAGHTKLDKNNVIVNEGIKSSFSKLFEYWIGNPWFYNQVLPDESFLFDRFGYVGPDDGSSHLNSDGSIKFLPSTIFYPGSMINWMGNGKKSYFLSGSFTSEVYRYTPPQK